MLQQTRVETVRPRFSEFLAAFPTPAALAAAPEEAVLSHWSGLGYYERARRLRRGASVVADRPAGAFPRDPEAARAIPGVGLYTAAAILSISYDLPHAAVDGNVARVLTRLHRLEPPHDRPGARTRMLAQALLDPAHPGDHNQAMMELGAVICFPAGPACTATGTGRGGCPVVEHCRAHAAGMTHRYPARRSRPAQVALQATLFLLRDRKGRLLIERDHWQFLRRLWLPVIRPGAIDMPGALPARFRVRAGSLREAGRMEHTITKHRIRLRVFTGLVDPGPGPLPTEHLLVTDAELASLGHSSILEKALRAEHTAVAGQRPGGGGAAVGQRRGNSRAAAGQKPGSGGTAAPRQSSRRI
jgi:A/G-specific adenine glycosylase